MSGTVDRPFADSKPGMPNFDGIPTELQALPHWVLWRSEERGGKHTKVPYQARAPAQRASSTDPSTWATFEEEREAFGKSGSEQWREHGIQPVDGIGIVLTGEAGIVAVDFDHCRPAGQWDEEVLARARGIGSYTEISPSGDGFHVFTFGTLPGPSKRKGNLELYDGTTGRYFTVTGAHLDGTPTAVTKASPGSVEALYASIVGEADPTPAPAAAPAGTVTPTDEGVLERCRTAKNGPKFERLWNGDTGGYGSASEADLALCSILAYQAGSDYGTVDRLFRRSGLFRAKWDERRGRHSYGELTLLKAISEQVSVVR